jgi:hypothetical protein
LKGVDHFADTFLHEPWDSMYEGQLSESRHWLDEAHTMQEIPAPWRRVYCPRWGRELAVA